jgi:hypothetical protein
MKSKPKKGKKRTVLKGFVFIKGSPDWSPIEVCLQERFALAKEAAYKATQKALGWKPVKTYVRPCTITYEI